jgi:hypothetical protein
MQRIKFVNSEIREDFFIQSRDSFQCEDWHDLYFKLKIPKASFEKYKNGKSTLSEKTFYKLSKNFKQPQLDYLKNNIIFLDEGWGRRKGGSITYKRYKHLFDEGRKKGLLKIKKEIHRFDMAIPLTKELAYFVGLFIGDGFTNKYNYYYLTQFVGNVSETDFYNSVMAPMVFDLFGIKARIRHEKHVNAIRFNLYSVDLFLLLTERFGIAAGVKTKTVQIPEEIINSSSEILLSCVAGIYDAECCIFFDKRKSYQKPYPRIDLHMTNPRLLRQISIIFKKVGINYSIRGDYERILHYGEKNIKQFLINVPLRNTRNLERLGYLANLSQQII